MRISTLMIALLLSLFICLPAASLAATLHKWAPDNDLWQEDQLGFHSGISSDLFNFIIDSALEVYTPIAKKNRETLLINKRWDDSTVNADCLRMEKVVVINLYGGAARSPEIIPEALVGILCHEIGHAYGGSPYISQENRISAEGQSDYWGAKSCIRQLLPKIPPSSFTSTPYIDKVCDSKFKETVERDFCRRSLAGGNSMGALLARIARQATPNYETPDRSVTNSTIFSYPATVQCRLDTYLRATLLRSRPPCWFTIDGNPEPDVPDSTPPITIPTPSQPLPVPRPTAAPIPTALPLPTPVSQPDITPFPLPPTLPLENPKIYAMAFIKKDPNMGNYRQKVLVTIQNHESYPVLCKSIEMNFLLEDGEGTSLGVVPILLKNIRIESGKWIIGRDESSQIRVLVGHEFPRYSIKEVIGESVKYNCFRDGAPVPQSEPNPEPRPTPQSKPTPRGTPEPQPAAVPFTDTWVEIKNPSTEKCLDVTGMPNNSERLAPLLFSDCGDTDNQKFWLSSNNGLIKIKGSSLCLEIGYEGNIVQNDCKIIASQRFLFTYSAFGGFEIRPVNQTNLCLTSAQSGNIELNPCKILRTQVIWIREIRGPQPNRE